MHLPKSPIRVVVAFLVHALLDGHTGHALPDLGNIPLGKIVYEDNITTTEKQNSIRDAIKWAWDGYHEDAWGYESISFNPSRQGIDGGIQLGATIIDSLDTLHIAGLEDELSTSRAYLERSFSQKINQTQSISLFEVTIRCLGGLLSIHALTEDHLYLDKAIELGEALLPAFDYSGLPCSNYNVASRSCAGGGTTSVADAGTLQLEFRELSRASGDPRFGDKASAAFREIVDSSRNQPIPYLLPDRIDFNAQPRGGGYHIDGGYDSYVEYLLKLWIQGDQSETELRSVYNDTMGNLILFCGVDDNDGTIIGRLNYPLSMDDPFENLQYIRSDVRKETGHLSCFAPGLIALAFATKNNTHTEASSNLEFAERYLDTCWQLYNLSLSGVSGEQLYIQGVTEISNNDNFLRPEVAESLFYLWRVTGNNKYRVYGWQMFSALERYAKQSAPGGYCALRNAASLNPYCPYPSGYVLGSMPSYFVAETLKYLYLLFDDNNTIPLDEWVFNTEAHPLPIAPQRPVLTVPSPTVDHAVSLSSQPSESPSTHPSTHPSSLFKTTMSPTGESSVPTNAPSMVPTTLQNTRSPSSLPTRVPSQLQSEAPSTILSTTSSTRSSTASSDLSNLDRSSASGTDTTNPETIVAVAAVLILLVLAIGAGTFWYMKRVRYKSVAYNPAYDNPMHNSAALLDEFEDEMAA